MDTEERGAIREAIDTTIRHFLREDPYYYIAPFLSTEDIDKTCPFFKDNGISLPAKNIVSDDLKTMSYLAPLYRNRIAYDPKSIDRYLWSLGHTDYNKSSFDLLCYETAPTWYADVTINLGIHVSNNLFISN